MENIVTQRSINKSEMIRDAKMEVASDFVRDVVMDFIERDDKQGFAEIQKELTATLNAYKEEPTGFTARRVYTKK